VSFVVAKLELNGEEIREQWMKENECTTTLNSISSVIDYSL